MTREGGGWNGFFGSSAGAGRKKMDMYGGGRMCRPGYCER